MSGWPPRRRPVLISEKMWADPRVCAAWEAHKGSVGLWTRSLSWLSEQYLSDHERYCIPEYEAHELSGMKRPWRMNRALVEADLWRPIYFNGTKRLAAWEIVQNDLWRWGPDREPIPRALREAVIARDKGVCQLCRQPVRGDQVLHIDHIYPVARGGRSTLDNLQVAHSTCNIRKGARVAT